MIVIALEMTTDTVIIGAVKQRLDCSLKNLINLRTSNITFVLYNWMSGIVQK